MEVLQGYKGYSGKVIKVSPAIGGKWSDYSRTIYNEWELFDTGPYQITVSMSVLAEHSDSGRPTISAYRTSDKEAVNPSNIKWTGPGNIGWTIQSGDDNTAQFGGNAVEIPAGRWVDLSFSQAFEFKETGDWQVFLDGHNDHQGLVDMTLYIRHFKVTVRNSLKYIALTFDEVPSDFTGFLLDKLDDLDVRATFFVSGMGIEARHPVSDRNFSDEEREEASADRKEDIKRMIEDGHEVANLAYTRNYFGGGKLDGSDGIDPRVQKSSIIVLPEYSADSYPLNEAAIRREINDTQIAIQKAVYGEEDYLDYPWVSKYFRMPINVDIAKAAALKKVTADMGLPIISGIDTNNNSRKSPEAAAEDIFSQITPWSISINKDPRFDPTILSVLDILIPKLKTEGYLFITLSEMAGKRRSLHPGSVYVNLDPDFP